MLTYIDVNDVLESPNVGVNPSMSHDAESDTVIDA